MTQEIEHFFLSKINVMVENYIKYVSKFSHLLMVLFASQKQMTRKQRSLLFKRGESASKSDRGLTRR